LNILITGGAAFIGSRLARSLLQQGHSVTVLDNFNPQIRGTNTELTAHLRQSVRLVRGDARDREVWASTLPGYDVIVNLAAETGTEYEVAKYEQASLAGTALLYDLPGRNANHGVELIVVVSSGAISVMQVVNRYFGCKSKVQVTGAFRDGDIRGGMADLERARALLGYEPRVKFEDGLRSLLACAEESMSELSGYERSLEEMKDRGLLHGHA
jgi:nucleoside-diphosphate-sugar epimerase